MTYIDVPPVMNAQQVADLFGCSLRHVRRLIKEGRLGHVRLGRLVRVCRHHVVEFLEYAKGPDTSGPSVAPVTNSDQRRS